jgi:hypothetical protein
MAADTVSQSGDVDERCAIVGDAGVRVLDFADFFVEPIDVAVVRSGNSQSGNGGASRMVGESIYDGIGHVPEKLGGGGGGDWGNGGIRGRGFVFGEYRVGAAGVSQLYSAVYGGGYIISPGASVSAASGAGIEASGCGLGECAAMMRVVRSIFVER